MDGELYVDLTNFAKFTDTQQNWHRNKINHELLLGSLYYFGAHKCFALMNFQESIDGRNKTTHFYLEYFRQMERSIGIISKNFQWPTSNIDLMTFYNLYHFHSMQIWLVLTKFDLFFARSNKMISIKFQLFNSHANGNIISNQIQQQKICQYDNFGGISGILVIWTILLKWIFNFSVSQSFRVILTTFTALHCGWITDKLNPSSRPIFRTRNACFARGSSYHIFDREIRWKEFIA